MSGQEDQPGRATGVLSVPHGLERRKETIGASQYTPEWETKTAISQILDIVLKPVSFTQQLTEILDVIVSISWLRAEKKGAIFVANSRNELVLAAHHDMAPSLLQTCARVPFGRCLCGRAATEKRILFRDCVDEDHENSYSGMREHGHYNIPLLDNRGRAIGVVVLYLEHGHRPHPEEQVFTAMLGRTLSSVILSRDLQLQSEIRQIRLQKAHVEILHKLVSASEFRDNETGQHIKRVSRYAALIGEKIGLSPERVELLESATPMHDIGKIGIPDQILLKPGKLTAEEFSVMQRHTEIGAKLLSGSHPLMTASRQIALSHHEKWDGTGYPRRLAGEDIPLFGRICALVDVFDALTTRRPYKEIWPLEKALALLEREAGSHFDPRLVAVFTECLPEVLEIKSLHGDDHQKPSSTRVLEPRAVSSERTSWKSEYSVGIDSIDDQHRYLVDLIDRVGAAIEENDSSAILESILDMALYAEIHFADEEEMMLESGYPRLAQHQELHRAFLNKSRSFLDELEQTPLATTAEVSDYLMRWLVVHIQKEDWEFAEFFREGRPSGE